MDNKGIMLEKLPLYGSKEAVIQNLEDAGCAPDIIESCIICLEQGQKNELLKQLEEHRTGLLNKVHEAEKHIDCLDYFVYQLSQC